METLVVDGIEVRISQTLHCFLMKLTSHFNPVTVWLDAICIDQRSRAERNWQVSIMQQIFESAEKVFAWLGYGDSDCNLAMSHITKISLESARSQSVEPRMLEQYLEQLLLRPYWSRTWVIQEAVLAKELWLLYGSEIAPWSEFVDAVNSIYRVDSENLYPHLKTQKTVEGSLGQLAHCGDERETEAYRRFLLFKDARESLVDGKSDLLSLAALFQHTNCLDPRDKLYGLRGIASDGENLEINYSKSIAQVFSDGLSLATPTVNRLGSYGLGLPNSKIDHALALCSSLAIPRQAVVQMLYSTQCEGMQEFLTEHGVVSSCQLQPAIHQPNSSRACQYSEVRVRVKTAFEERMECYYTSKTVLPGDKVFGLLSPGDGDEESDEPPTPFLLVFRDDNAHSRAIDKLVSPKQMRKFQNYRQDTIDVLLRRTVRLGAACIDHIEICRTNRAAMDVLHRIPGVILVHISRVTILALIAWFKCKDIPGYVSEAIGAGSPQEYLCQCPTNAKIVMRPRTRESEEITIEFPEEPIPTQLSVS